MQASKEKAVRGRPPTITRERIADVGIKMGLSSMTFVGVAAELGVSHMALYKHVPSLEELKYLVAEELFRRWQIPAAVDKTHESLKDYLHRFVAAICYFVKTNPGVTPYVIRRFAATQSMLDKIAAHQSHIAQAYTLSLAQARVLLATIAFHAMAVADTVYSVAGQEPVVAANRNEEESEMEAELLQGMHALIIGALTLLEKGELCDHLRPQETQPAP